MKPIKLKIKTLNQKHSVIIGLNLISRLSFYIKQNSISFEKCLLVIDKNVPQKMITKIRKTLNKKKIYSLSITASEKNKNQSSVNRILSFLLKNNFSRQDCLISIGGGITGDIAGFSASLFKRGMQFINIPTTLLSQVDSSIGGKTGINSQYGKNQIGTFHQPKLVISDIIFLKSLPKREIICGYGEILKHSLIANKKFYQFLKLNFSKILNLESPFIEKAIFESCKIKKKVIEKDENERNLRKILNFGHTFGHAFEATIGYKKKLNHGEAVLLGMFTALRFSYDYKILKKNEFFSIMNHYRNPALPHDLKKYFSLKHLNKIIFYMLKDKKNYSNKISLVLLKKIGFPLINKTYNKNRLKVFLKKELIN